MTNKKRPSGAPGDIDLSPGGAKSYEGLPYRGEVRDFKDKDPEEKLPQMQYEAHVKVFNLTDKDDVEAYQSIVQDLVSDKAVLSYEEKTYDDKIQGWRLLIVYSDVFYTAPPEE